MKIKIEGKRLFGMLLGIFVVLGLMPGLGATAHALDGVGYLEAAIDDQNQVSFNDRTQDGCTEVDGEAVTWSDGWYVANNTVTIGGRVTVSGTVNLILCDGVTLTAQRGITVTTGDTLNIYAQSDGENKGKLIANTVRADPVNAPIGGENAEGKRDCGTVNIHGGEITADGKDGYYGGGGCAGIGGCTNGGTGGVVTIYGGKVYAKGGFAFGNGQGGAGIGGGGSSSDYGDGGDGGTVAIYGGEVEAVGVYSAGIGGGGTQDSNGTGGDGGTVAIYGGTVNAQGDSAAGIGGGNGYGRGKGGNGGTVAIYGGTVNARGRQGAGIGGGKYGNGGEVTITGGTVIAEVNEYGNGAGIGGGAYSGDGGDVTITGGTVTATGGSGGAGIGKGYADGNDGSITLGAGVKLETSDDNETWSDPTTDTSIRTRYMRTTYTPHTHEFTYAADGATITATCTADGCDLPPSTEGGADHVAILTIAAPPHATYGDGEDAEAVITDENAIRGEAKVQYRTKDEGGAYGSPTETAPTDAGEHMASITLGDATASVEYAVAKADPMASVPTGLTATYGDTLADVPLEGANPAGNTEGTWAWADASASVGDVVDPAATFKADFTPADARNYNTASADVTVTVGKAANPAAVEGPAAVAKGGNTVDLKGFVALNGATGEVGYAFEGDALGCSLSGSVLTSGDATGNVTVRVTVAADANHYASDPLPLTVTVSDKRPQTVTAGDVTVAFGDKGAKVAASTDGDGELGFAVTDGADVVAVDAKTGAITTKKVGKATVTVTAAETASCTQATKDVTVTVEKAPASAAQAPKAKSLTYNGKAQALVAAGKAEGGTMQYSLDGKSWSAKVPTGTNAGSYTVRYRVAGDASHTDAAAKSVKSTIAKAKLTSIAKVADQAYTGKAVTPKPAVKGGSKALKAGTDFTYGYKDNTKAGTATVTATGRGNYAGTVKTTFKIVAATTTGRAHLQGSGWQKAKSDPDLYGTTGKSLRMEALSLSLPKGFPVKGSIQYRSHLQGKGWETSWKKDGATSGTIGESRRIEAVQIKLTGDMAKKYDVYYRVHAQNYGWMGWARNGAKAGTEGMSKRAEAVQVVLVPKGAKAPGATYRGQTQGYAKAFVAK